MSLAEAEIIRRSQLVILNVEVDLPHDFINQLMAENVVESSIDVSTKQIKVLLLLLQLLLNYYCYTTTTSTTTTTTTTTIYYYLLVLVLLTTTYITSAAHPRSLVRPRRLPLPLPLPHLPLTQLYRARHLAQLLRTKRDARRGREQPHVRARGLQHVAARAARARGG
jgi:hypothetical protein